MGAAWLVILAVFLFDLLVSERGWCGRLCPVGAFYSILGKISVARVSAEHRDRCNDCTDCLRVCPEPHVLKQPVYGANKGASPIILSPNCTNCGRCIDVCTENVFRFTTRFDGAQNLIPNLAEETPTEPQRMRYLDDQDPFARDYEEQPPLVPHTTEKYAINLDENRCLECHSWADYEEAGATRVSESHFPDSLGGVTANVAGERYFCKQCHVAQVDAEPLIENTFEPIEAAAATE
jgi:nitrate reductase cytochrome c-type subunit